MKHKIHRGFGALIFFLLTTCATSATTRTRKATQPFSDDVDAEDAAADTVDEERNLMLSEVPKPASGGEAAGGIESPRRSGAFLEVSTASGQAVLDRLTKVETVAESQKQALRAQQEVMVALQEQQEYLQAHERELESNELGFGETRAGRARSGCRAGPDGPSALAASKACSAHQQVSLQRLGE